MVGMAVKNDNYPVLAFLVENGADVYASSVSMVPVCIMLGIGERGGGGLIREVIEYLVEHGAREYDDAQAIHNIQMSE